MSVPLSTPRRTARTRARGLVFGAVAVLALVLPIGCALPASAHDQVVSTVPAAGEHLETAPSEVSMTFTSDILDLGAIMLVVDTAGDDWAHGEPRLDGVLAVQTLADGLPDGAYLVRWRVVSADGHPISGTVDFTVGSVTTQTDAPGRESTSPAAAIGGDGTDPDPNNANAEATAPSARNGVSVWLTGLIGASVGLGIYLVVLVWRRQRPTSPRTDTPHTTPRTEI